MNDKVCLPTLNENYCERVYARGEEPEAYAVGCESLPPADVSDESAYTCLHLTDEASAPLRWGIGLRNFFWSPAPSDRTEAVPEAVSPASVPAAPASAVSGVSQGEPTGPTVRIPVRTISRGEGVILKADVDRAYSESSATYSMYQGIQRELALGAATDLAKERLASSGGEHVVLTQAELSERIEIVFGAFREAQQRDPQPPAPEPPQTASPGATRATRARPSAQGSRLKPKSKPKKVEDDGPLY